MDQLRIYAIKPGAMALWVAEWKARIVPLRRRHGFEVLSAWSIQGEDRFVWILRLASSKPWEEADSEYYASAERKALDPDPARHIATAEQWFLTPILAV